MEAIQVGLRPSERLFAFLDDIYAVCSPGRAADVFTTIQEQLATMGIRVHDGKTQLWNRAARRSDPDAIVWRGDTTLPPEAQGDNIGQLGHVEFVRARLVTVSAKHDRSQIVGMPDLQRSWILLLFCAVAWPNFAAHHDASLRRALSQLVAAPPTHMFWDVACLPFSRGGMGLRSAVLTSGVAYWASWADNLHMIKQRHQQSRTRFSMSWPAIKRQDSTFCSVTDSWRVATRSTTGGRPPNRHAWRWVATGSHRRSPHTLGRDVCQTKEAC